MGKLFKNKLTQKDDLDLVSMINLSIVKTNVLENRYLKMILTHRIFYYFSNLSN